MERYQRLYQLPENLYVYEAPIIISAGALTKDNNTNRIFIQLKTKNISKKVIKALFVRIIGYDATKTKVDDIIRYEYLDLNCKFGEEFGSKVPIYLNNTGIRYFLIRRIRVIFNDDSVCSVDFSNVKALPKRKLLSDKYDEDQITQFKSLFGDKCKFIPDKYEDLYFCSCGCMNKSGKCLACGGDITSMLDVDPDELKKDWIYNKASRLLVSDNDSDLLEAVNLFESIIDWKDSRVKTDECNAKIEGIKISREKAKARNKKIAMIGGPIVAALIVFAILMNNVILPTSNYKKALAAADKGNFSEAYSLFNNFPDYKDSASKAKEYEKLYSKILLQKAKVGDTIIFGAYEQDNILTNGKEDIGWRVLAKEDNKLLIISEYALDCQQYNTEYTSVTWETCSLRKWLNETFVKEAFSAEEQKMIPETKVTADANPGYSTDPGNDTTDKVFLLSITEAQKYFSNADDRMCVPTAYAIEQGAYTSSSYTKGGNATWWWLRSPGCGTDYAAVVGSDGGIPSSGYRVYYTHGGVRPALWIEI